MFSRSSRELKNLAQRLGLLPDEIAYLYHRGNIQRLTELWNLRPLNQPTAPPLAVKRALEQLKQDQGICLETIARQFSAPLQSIQDLLVTYLQQCISSSTWNRFRFRAIIMSQTCLFLPSLFQHVNQLLHSHLHQLDSIYSIMQKLFDTPLDAESRQLQEQLIKLFLTSADTSVLLTQLARSMNLLSLQNATNQTRTLLNQLISIQGHLLSWEHRKEIPALLRQLESIQNLISQEIHNITQLETTIQDLSSSSLFHSSDQASLNNQNPTKNPNQWIFLLPPSCFKLLEKKEAERLINLETELNMALFPQKSEEIKGYIPKAKRIRGLILSNLNLETFPGTIVHFSHLQTLDLSSNLLTSLPESIHHLTSLRKLLLHQNQLDTLPKSIGSLKNLTELTLWKNQLVTLPESIGKLTRIQRLDLSWNKLQSLPESIGNLSNLQVLDLCCNQLSTLPETIGSLPRLRELWIQENPLLSLPETIQHRKGLSIFT